MTREEAIIQLEYRKDFATKDQIEALDMAITALQNEQRILDCGLKGEETRFCFCGRLFEIRELAQ